MPGLRAQNGITVLDGARSDVFDVRTYGAKGDGVTDDTAAVQAAITAAGGGTVYFPKGYYIISSTLTLAEQGVTLVGESTADTIFQWAGTTNGLMFRLGYKWQTLRNLRITGNCKGARCASLVDLNQKTATFDHVWFHNTGSYGALIESGDGQAQCDNNSFNRCEFAGPATGLWLNSTEADFVHVVGCEFSGCTAAGIRGQQGGFVTVRNTIFGTCARDIQIQAGDAGLEQLYLDTVQGESHSSGYGIEIRSTCLTFLAHQCIFGDKTYLATNNRYTFIGCYFNAPGIETNGSGATFTEIGCWWAASAVVTDLATTTRRQILSPGGPGAGNVGEPARLPSLTVHPQQTPGTGTIKTYGSASSAVAMHQAFIDGVEAWRTIQDATNGLFCHGTPGGFNVKATGNGASDLGIYLSDGAPANSRSSVQIISGPHAGAGQLIRLAVSGSSSAVLSLAKNNGALTLPDRLQLQYDDTEKASVQSGGLAIGASGTPIAKHLSATYTWNPASMADGAVTSVQETVAGAALGDMVHAAFDQIGTNDVLISASVAGTDNVKVILLNKSGGALDLGSGTLRIDVWKH